ncbi:MAG TPA: carboxypeptidase regulatory-like domain-containing protein, partial [Thermoanaerobaculia bacterium]
MSGTVTAADTRQTLRGMVVAVYDAAGSLSGTATTDATGFYSVTLPAGNYRVLAYDPLGAYATAFDGNAQSFSTSPVVSLGATQNLTINFVLPVGTVVSGIVQTPGGALLPGATVAAYNLSGTLRGFTTTDLQGGYSLVLPAGEYKLVAYDESASYASSFYRNAFDFISATPVRTGSTPATGINFRLTVAARVLSTVVDASTRQPLAGITVYAFTESGVPAADTKTDANGVFRFALPAGRYRFVTGDETRRYAPAFHAGRRSFAEADLIEVTAGNIVSFQIAASRGGIVAGRVINELAGVTVAAYNIDGTLHASTTTTADGRYELLLAPGNY